MKWQLLSFPATIIDGHHSFKSTNFIQVGTQSGSNSTLQRKHDEHSCLYLDFRAPNLFYKAIYTPHVLKKDANVIIK